MRTIPANLLTNLQSRRMFRATLVQVDFVRATKASVTQLGFTDHDVTLNANLSGGAIDFSPEYIVEMPAVGMKLNTSIDDSELVLKIDDDVVNWFDIRTRAWHNAQVTVGHVNWKNTGHGTYIKAVFLVSNVTTKGGKLKLELRGKERLLETPVTKRLTGTCQHTFADTRCGYDLDVPQWAAATLFATSADRDWKAKVIVKPTTQNGFWYEATTGGTSHATTEPVWPTVVGNTIVDGTVTWTCIRAGRLVGTVTAVTDRREFAASGASLTSGWFAKGRILWLTGDNATQRMKVNTDDGAGAFTLEEDVYLDIQVGDTFQIDAGCRKRISTDCSTKFDNTYNAWAFPHLVNENALVKAPKG